MAVELSGASEQHVAFLDALFEALCWLMHLKSWTFVTFVCKEADCFEALLDLFWSASDLRLIRDHGHQKRLNNCFLISNFYGLFQLDFKILRWKRWKPLGLIYIHKSISLDNVLDQSLEWIRGFCKLTNFCFWLTCLMILLIIIIYDISATRRFAANCAKD